MVWFSKQKIIIIGAVVGITGAYLVGWFDILVSLARGQGIPSSVSLPVSVGSILLALGPWIMRASNKFAKSKEV